MSEQDKGAGLEEAVQRFRKSAKRALTLERHLTMAHQYLTSIELTDDTWPLSVPLKLEYEAASVQRDEGDRAFSIWYDVRLVVDQDVDPEDPHWLDIAEADDEERTVGTFRYSQRWSADQSLKDYSGEVLGLFANSVGINYLVWSLRDFMAGVTLQLGRPAIAVVPPATPHEHLTRLTALVEGLLRRAETSPDIRVAAEPLFQ